VALGKAGGEVFKATVSQIDLQGAWLLMPGKPVNDNITCLNSTEDSGINTSINSQSLLMLSTYIGALGDYRPDAAGNGLTWGGNAGRTPAEVSSYIGSMLQFEGVVLPSVDKIQMQNSFEWVRAASQAPAQPQRPLLLLGLAIVVPGVWGLRGGRKRPYGSFISLVLAIFLLAGCVGFGFNMWGTVTSEAQFTQFEYLGGESIPVIGPDSSSDTVPLWRLRGTADYVVDFYVEASTDTVEGESATAVTHCTGTATYNVEAQVFKDIVVNLE
jgi:hypothetical protein